MSTNAASRLPAGQPGVSADTNSCRLEASHSFVVDGRVDDVFGLFDAVSERDWVDDWDPAAIYPAELSRAEGTVFTTERDGRLAVWTVLRYSAEQHVAEYLALEIGYQHRWIYVSCCGESDDKTRVMVRYVTTALTPEGQRDIGRYGREYLEGWKAPVQDALALVAA